MPEFNFEKLKSEILSRSKSEDWLSAKLEWSVDYIYKTDNDETFLCEHFPIKELCVLKNSTNGDTAVVGNVCVKKFFDMKDPTKIFNCLTRIQKNPTKAMNVETIQYAQKKGWLWPWAFDFLLGTQRRHFKKLSPKQQLWRKKVNKIVAGNINSAKRPQS